MMKNWKIRTKILAGFVAAIIIAVSLGITGVTAINTLAGISEELREMQKTTDGIAKVLNAHYIWRQGLTETALTGREFKGSLDPETCALGNWLLSFEAENMTDPELLSLLQSIIEPHAFIHKEAKTVIDYMISENPDAATTILTGSILPKTQEVITALSGMQERCTVLVDNKTAELIKDGALLTTLIIAIVAIGIVVCVLMSWKIPAIIVKPLIPLTNYLHKASTTGDLSLSAADIKNIEHYVDAKDETGQLIKATSQFVGNINEINKSMDAVAAGDLTYDIRLLSDKDSMGIALSKMMESLNDMFGKINDSAIMVSAGSKQVADGSQALAVGATEQAASIEELSSSVTEIAHRTKENAETANKTVTLADSIEAKAEKGNLQMGELMEAVNEINAAGKNISKVIKVIDDIAFQTNILALNAAVEAARAGQQGKGFAVVAEEVRNLAAKSAEAAKETEEMIQNSLKKAEFGSQIAGETAESLADIVSGIHESNELVRAIARSAEEESQSISQINIGIEQITNVTQQNSATAEESAATAEEMSGQSAVLMDLVSQFTLKGRGMGRV